MASRGIEVGRTLRLPVLATVISWPRWLVLTLAAVVARIFTFGNPLVHIDEEFYLLTAQRMLQGAVPFVDVWDRKPIGLFLIYLPPALFEPQVGVWVYQLLALASVVATALLIARIAERAGWERGALGAALLYISMLNFADGQGGQAPVFYNLLMVGAVALILPLREDREDLAGRRRGAFGALGLVGVALQVKYSVLFEGMFLGLWLMWREHRFGATLGETIRFGLALIGVALIPTALAGAVYVAIGHGGAWFYANFGSILHRRSDPGIVQIKSLLKMALIMGWPLFVCGLARRVPPVDSHERDMRALLFGWLIASIVGLMIFGGYFNHYILPLMVPTTLCCAVFWSRHRWGQAMMVVMLVTSLGSIYVTWSARQVRGNGAELEAMAQAIGRGPECIYVYSGSPTLYGYTGRCAASPYLFPSHLARERENGALGVDQLEEIDRIFSRRPKYVVMRPYFLGERMASRQRMLEHLATDGYAKMGSFPVGNLMIDVFEAQAAPARAAVSPRRAASSDS